MRTKLWKFALGAVAAAAFSANAVADAPKYGGTLNFVVGSKIPSYDGHIEQTFGMIHPIAPFYSLLIRVNPDNPSDATDLQCDVCESFDVSADGKTYTFKILKGIKFTNGEPLDAKDVLATYNKIIFPPYFGASATALAETEELFANPLHPYTQGLLEAVPIPDPVVERERAHQVIKGEIPSPINPPSGCVFHPRCPKAVDGCKVNMPEFREVKPGHWVACTEV